MRDSSFWFSGIGHGAMGRKLDVPHRYENCYILLAQLLIDVEIHGKFNEIVIRSRFIDEEKFKATGVIGKLDIVDSCIRAIVNGGKEGFDGFTFFGDERAIGTGVDFVMHCCSRIGTH